MKYVFNQYFWLSLIVLLGLFVRLYKIDSPVADWHSWRQADTVAVTRNFVKEGFNPFYPKYDDMSGISEKPYPNPGRFRFVEFPIYNIVTLPLYILFGAEDQLSRAVSILFSLGSIIFIYLITKKFADNFIAFCSAFLFAVLPFNVFFSRTTLPEPTFVFFALGMIYFASEWIQNPTLKNMVAAYFFTSFAFLIKPWAIFFVLPLIYLGLKKDGIRFFIKPKIITFTILALLPFIFWRLWILQYPEGIPASSWLLNSDGIRFRPAFWWWIVSERIGREILGLTGAVLFFIGLLLKPKNDNFFLHFWALSSFLFMVIFATGNVRHNYYQILFVPIASIFTAIGFSSLLFGIRDFVPRLYTIPLAILFLSLAIYFSWTQVREFYKINNPPIIEAGKRADQILPKSAVVVAPYNGDTAFLYQTNRPGWPVTALPLVELVSTYGATHFVSVTNDAKTNWVKRHFVILEEKPDYVIVDLTKLKKPLDPEDREP